MDSKNPFAAFADDGFDDSAAAQGSEMISVAQAKAGKEYIEQCPKCQGSGRFRTYGGRDGGACYACKGRGSNTYKTSAASREKARDDRTVKRIVHANTYFATYPAEIDWLQRAAKRNSAQGGAFTFPADLLGKINQYGSLTDNQLAAVRKMMARDAEQKAKWTAERAARDAAAPAADTAGVDRLKQAFDAAIAYSAAKGKGIALRSPRITIGNMSISPAKATSANPGALYVKTGETYLGKVKDGRFFASRDCTPETEKQVLAFVADPEAAAKVYGQETGVCCICNATLTSEWRLRGIGPICAEKFGWA